MKTDFILYKENSNKSIIVNEQSNTELLQRCQDNWYHRLEIKYLETKNWYDKLGWKFLPKRKDKIEYLFIHIPKTGGISFKFNVIYNQYMNKKIAVYHKFNFPPNNVSELDIFKEEKKMFTLLRNPTNTVISAYFHFNHVIKMSLVDFCNKYTNIQIKFLLGYDICSSYEVNEVDFNRIKKLIDEKRLVVGVHMTKKMNDIYNLLDLDVDKVDKYVLNKKIGSTYKYKDIPMSLKRHIKKINIYDSMLYDYVLNC